MGKRKEQFDEDQWQAENQVRDALMSTPEVKKLVRQTKKEIKAHKAKVKRQVRLKKK